MLSLNDVLAALSENMLNIEITRKITEDNVTEEVPIIEFEAPGYEALSNELLEQEVDKITIDRSSISTSVTILLKDNETP